MNVASKTLFALLTSAALLSACGSKEEAPAEAPAAEAPAAAAPAPAAPEPVKEEPGGWVPPPADAAPAAAPADAAPAAAPAEAAK